ERDAVFRYVAGAGPPDVLAHLARTAAPRALVEDAFARADDALIEVADAAHAPAVLLHVPPGLVSSHLSVPLWRDERVTGLLSLGFVERTGRFSRRQVALARGLAHHAGAALENARL